MSYYRYYKRPYYRKRSSYRRKNPLEVLIGIVGVFFVLALFGLFSSAASNPAGFIQGLLGWAFLALIIYLVYKGFKKLFGSAGTHSDALPHLNNPDIEAINSEKHGCKCYMEGLTLGEQEVADTLSRELSYKDYFMFNNLILPSENNGSTQIDHIVVSRFGVFVIESKDYQGWLFGDRDGKMWTQSLPGGKNKFQFQNPIHQNYAHIMALKNLMPFVGDNFYGIVVFSDQSEIKTAPIPNVVHLSQLIGCIKQHMEQKLSDNDIQLAIGKLSYACQTVDITAAEHVANLQAHKVA